MPETGRLDGKIFKALLPYVWRYRWRTFLSLLLLLAAKGATVAVPLVLKQVVDTLDVEASDAIIVPLGLLVAYGGLRLASTLFRELQSTLFAWVQYDIVREIAGRVLSHLHSLSLRFHLDRKTGAVARDIDRGTSSVSTFLNYLLFNIVPTIVEVGLVAAILLREYSLRFALVCVVAFVAYVGFTFGITRWRLKYRTEMNQRDSLASSQAIDGLINYETVKYFGNERFELERYGEALAAWSKAGVRSQSSLALLNVGQGLIIAGAVTWTMVLAAQGVADRELTIGDLVAVNAYLIQIFLPLGFLGTVYSILKHALADMERMFDLLERKPEIVDLPDAQPLAVTGGHVRFDNVRFSYNDDREVLHGITIDIPAGQRVAVVGPSGSGKSTLARLLFRFYDVSSGRVTIDGQDLRHVAQQSVRDAIGIVPQDTVLFNDTLHYNLQYARLDATDDEIIEAARAANIHDFVSSLPQGYDTLVGERGLKLSGGEKQRVAIARALLKRPRILVFDEATSSLDSRSEQAILEAMRRVAAGHTSLVIAHRLSTIVDADRIVVLRDGEVVEQGTHAELLGGDGLYAEMWRLQQEARDDETDDLGGEPDGDEPGVSAP